MNLRSACLAAFLAVVAAPATAHAVASAELFKNQAYRYGRFEARIRYAAGDGVISSFFLWKVGSEVAGTYWNELDFEKLGADCRMQTNTLYGNPTKSGEQTRTMPAGMCDAYHDYRFEWTPTYIAWVIDSQEIRRETGAVAAAFADNAPDGMRMHFNVWPGNANFGGNFNASILPVRQYISWVQYSSFQNDSFKLEWREDFNGSAVPSGWTTGTWASPLNLSTHDTRNVTFSNGIAVLSVTADNATGFTGTVPPDNSGGMSGSGGSSGGAGNGGAANAGAGNGGTSKGGATSGGAMNGGTANGGTTSGGAVSGGANFGGTSGTSSGGQGNGGDRASGGVAGSSATTGGTAGAGTPNASGGALVTGTGGVVSGGATSTSAGTGGTSGAAGSPTGPASGGTHSGGTTNSAGVTSMSGGAAAAGNGGTEAATSSCSYHMAPALPSRALFVGLAMLVLTARRRARSEKQTAQSNRR